MLTGLGTLPINLYICAVQSWPSLLAHKTVKAKMRRPINVSNEPGHTYSTVFPTNLHVQPAKTQISSRIHAVWSVATGRSMSRQGSKVSSEGRHPHRLIRVFAGRTCSLTGNGVPRFINVRVHRHIPVGMYSQNKMWMRRDTVLGRNATICWNYLLKVNIKNMSFVLQLTTSQTSASS